MTISNRMLQEIDKSPITLSSTPNRTLGEVKDLRNKKFEHLIVKSYFGKKKNHTYWKCLCDCGNETIVRRENLINKSTISCGHISKELSSKRIKKRSTIHGASKENWYGNYSSMITRTTNINSTGYKYYHNKHPNISKWIEQEWLEDPWKFYNEIGPKPNKNSSIDRIDNNKGYIKKNVRWSNKHQQSINRNWTSKSETKIVGIAIKHKGESGMASTLFYPYISINNKKIQLGSYDTLEEAKVVRYKAEEKYGYKHTFKPDLSIIPKQHIPKKNKNYKEITINGRYNELTVLYKDKTNNKNYICRCDCGNLISVRKYRILEGLVKKCNKHRSKQKSNFYCNKKYNQLTLLNYSYSDKNKNVYWDAMCDCGKKITLPINSVLSGHTKYCGHDKYTIKLTSPQGKAVIYKNIKDFLNDNNLNKIPRMPSSNDNIYHSKRSKLYNYKIEKIYYNY